MLKPIMLLESEGNIFFKFYWFLIKNEKYKSIKNDSKILYCLYMDRVSLSIKNNWTNDKGEVYIIFTNEEVEKELNMSRPTVIKCKKELTNVGLIKEQRQGLNKPNLIYLFNDDFGTEKEEQCDTYQLLTSRPQDGTKNINEIIADKKVKVNKMSKNQIKKDSNFEQLWALYPSKKGKTHVNKDKKEEINNYHNLEELIEYLKQYKKDKNLIINGGWKNPKNGSTFFNNLIEEVNKQKGIDRKIEEKINTKVVKVASKTETKNTKQILF